MTFYSTIERYQDVDFEAKFAAVTAERVQAALDRATLTVDDFLALLSPVAVPFLEEMAAKAHQLTVQYFGRTIQLYIPLYISNFCSNKCVYCGFHTGNRIKRAKLSLEEIELEARAIAASGMQHILFLTGEAPEVTPMSYLEDTVALLKKYFASVSIEIYPMDVDDYARLKNAGADGLTIYQETYNRDRYKLVHLGGRKMDFRYRLEAPERGAEAGLRQVNLGPLLGLGEPRSEVFFLGLHARHLEDIYLNTEVGVSLPRMNPAEGNYRPDYHVDDRTFVQFLTALRCFLPRSGISVSTRESARFRDNLIRLGVTRYSAGSRTGVGGYCEEPQESTPQFEITDDRTIVEVVGAIRQAGYQPVYKDWDRI
jgi:2-iminoacetate synthase